MTVKKRVAVPPQASNAEQVSPFSFTYEEFVSWYDLTVETRLEPARVTFVRLLNEWLTYELSDSDRKRVRISNSRIKGPGRLWTKMQKNRYREKITSLASIVDIIDDIVGIRITCHNNCDMNTLRELIATLPDSEDQNEWLCVQPGSEKRYVDDPKESGYRAYHVNLRTLLQTPQGWVSVHGELQARTLLQDGWGELTHEDTYKPGVELPGLATKLARRMADLLAAVDDLAQDLRDELDRLATESVGQSATSEEPSPVAERQTIDTTPLQSALLAETRRVVLGLTKPATMASVAQLVQASFGTGITEGWGGLGSFANLVREAVPGATVQTSPPGWVVPPGFVPHDRETGLLAGAAPDVPVLVRRLRSYDQNVPQYGRERMSDLLDVVAESLKRPVWEMRDLSVDDPSIRELNALTKYGRDYANDRNLSVSRAGLNYVMRALLFHGNLVPDLPRRSAATIVESAFFERAQGLGVVEDSARERGELKHWLGVE